MTRWTADEKPSSSFKASSLVPPGRRDAARRPTRPSWVVDPEGQPDEGDVGGAPLGIVDSLLEVDGAAALGWWGCTQVIKGDELGVEMRLGFFAGKARRGFVLADFSSTSLKVLIKA